MKEFFNYSRGYFRYLNAFQMRLNQKLFIFIFRFLLLYIYIYICIRDIKNGIKKIIFFQFGFE